MNTGTIFRYSIRARLLLVLTAAVVYSCTLLNLAQAVEIGAHRGGYFHAPENTLAAFQAASATGADWIELDVRTSFDGHLVVIHDETVNRTTTGYGPEINVANLTLAQLKELDAGSRFAPRFAGERIPTLAEALAAIPPEIGVIIDRKTGTAAEIVAALRAANRLTNIAVMAGSFDILIDMRRLEPDVRLFAAGAHVIGSGTINFFRTNGVFDLVWARSMITPQFVKFVQDSGLRIWAATTSGPDIQALLDLGVDGLLADHPRLARSLAQTRRFANPELARSLVAYWKFDDGLDNPLGLQAADVDQLAAGLLHNYPPGTAWLSGELARFDGALALNGAGSHVRMPAIPALDIGTNAVTLSLWVNLAKLPSQIPKSHSCIFDSDLDAYVVYLDRAARELRFKTTDVLGHAARPGIPEARLATGQWHHVVGVYDGFSNPGAGEALVYLDGVLQDVHRGDDYLPRTGLNATVRPGQIAAIGRNGPEHDYFFEGAVDDLAVWRRALSPAEVRQIYQTGTNGLPLERSVMTLWIANVYPDPANGNMRLEVRVEHGTLTNQLLSLRGAACSTHTYSERGKLEGGRGRSGHFRVPASAFAPGPGPADRNSAETPRFFQVVLP